jgi:hypothetical protein
MTAINQYRMNAEECLRHAEVAEDERDRPLWATLAQSWLRLAEHRASIGLDGEAGDAKRQDQVAST